MFEELVGEAGELGLRATGEEVERLLQELGEADAPEEAVEAEPKRLGDVLAVDFARAQASLQEDRRREAGDEGSVEVEEGADLGAAPGVADLRERLAVG